MRKDLLVFSITILFATPSLRSAEKKITEDQRERLSRGPLRISADESVSKEKGKIVEARGNVFVRYEMDSGDVLESFSQYARYDEKNDLGELWGEPKAFWKRARPEQAQTELTADKIILLMRNSEMVATGNVLVVQASSTLKANEIRFFNLEKKITSSKGRPLFMTQGNQQQIKISAENIVTWTEKKIIRFDREVRGVVEFSPQLR